MFFSSLRCVWWNYRSPVSADYPKLCSLPITGHIQAHVSLWHLLKPVVPSFLKSPRVSFPKWSSLERELKQTHPPSREFIHYSVTDFPKDREAPHGLLLSQWWKNWLRSRGHVVSTNNQLQQTDWEKIYITVSCEYPGSTLLLPWCWLYRFSVGSHTSHSSMKSLTTLPNAKY